MTFLVGAFLLVLFILLGIPVGFALGIAGVAGLAMIVPVDTILSLMTKVVHGTAGNYIIVTIPMFVLMAEFLGTGGIAQNLLVACNKLMSKLRGGMAIATILAGAVLASASGSSTASSASITRAAFPVMREAGYSPSFSVGATAIAGTLAIMIPPSIAFVLYGVMTETSIGKLFIAGIIPGALTVAGYILVINFLLWRRPELGPSNAQVASMSEDGQRGKVWPMVVLIVFVLGSLYTGLATPTEIAALGAIGALLISVAARRMPWSSFTEALGNTLRTTTMIVTIIFGAHLFGYFISFTRITDFLLDWIAYSDVPGFAVIILLVFVYLFLGMIMDQAAILILTTPITAPLVVGLGYDPVWWGVVVIKTAEIGMVSPPMGLNVFVASAASGTSLRDGFRGVVPFIAVEFVLLGLLVAFPALSLLLVG